jgi:hypothetical protein
MTVIDSYLDTLFAPYPSSPQMREARTELLAMMEDKLADLRHTGLSESEAVGKVIAEFGTLDEVAPVLGIEREVTAQRDGTPAEPDPRRLLDTEAIAPIESAFRGTRYFGALGVALFVLCPVPLFTLLALFTKEGIASRTVGTTGDALAIGIGIPAVLVGVLLGLLLTSRQYAALQRVPIAKDLSQGDAVLSASAQRHVTDLQHEQHVRSTLSRGAATGLFVLAAAPTIVCAVLSDPSSNLVLLGLCGTLVMVAIGVFLTTRDGWTDAYAVEVLPSEDTSPLRHLHRFAEASPAPAPASAPL